LKSLPSVTLLLADASSYAQQGKIDMIDGQFDKTTGAITLSAPISRMHKDYYALEIPVK
jgi:membrane fusion protein (multidrug efflux system)